MKQLLRASVMTFICLTIITGVIYPLIVTGLSQWLFPYQANGSLLTANGQLIGSELIGQNFSEDKYLWGRPSATSDHLYNALASGGTNLGPSNPQLLIMIKERLSKLNATALSPAPVDLVTSSGSGLDPEISIASAYFQMVRIAQVRGIGQDKVEDIINQFVHYPVLGIWGEARVNVLQVNLALDKIKYEEVR